MCVAPSNIRRPRRDREAEIAALVKHYNHWRYRESLDKVTPADAYFGSAETITNSAKLSSAEYSNIGAFSSDGSLQKIYPGQGHHPLIFRAFSDDGQPQGSVWPYSDLICQNLYPALIPYSRGAAVGL